MEMEKPLKLFPIHCKHSRSNERKRAISFRLNLFIFLCVSVFRLLLVSFAIFRVRFGAFQFVFAMQTDAGGIDPFAGQSSSIRQTSFSWRSFSVDSASAKRKREFDELQIKWNERSDKGPERRMSASAVARMLQMPLAASPLQLKFCCSFSHNYQLPWLDARVRARKGLVYISLVHNAAAKFFDASVKRNQRR